MSNLRELEPVIEVNARGIPKAIFLEDVEDWMKSRGGDTENALQILQETLSKYRFMETNSLEKVKSLSIKIPEFTTTLSMLSLLLISSTAAEPLITHFELSDTLYSKAIIPPTNSEVFLWLGAGTMLSYTIDQATLLITEKLETAKEKSTSLRKDLEWLRDQITVTQVNIARVYNYQIKLDREKKEKEKRPEI